MTHEQPLPYVASWLHEETVEGIRRRMREWQETSSARSSIQRMRNGGEGFGDPIDALVAALEALPYKG